MNVTLFCNDKGCRLVFAGSMTFEFARYIEDRILDALRRYRHFEVDLSAVSEIDVCGVHLLGVLRTIGGDGVEIVASSPAVRRGTERALAGGRGYWLRGGGGECGSARAAQGA
jgi:ABC-type transporter Mla MlaB component